MEKFNLSRENASKKIWKAEENREMLSEPVRLPKKKRKKLRKSTAPVFYLPEMKKTYQNEPHKDPDTSNKFVEFTWKGEEGSERIKRIASSTVLN